MALTLEAEQKLEAGGLVELFTTHQAAWTAAAQDAFTFVRKTFPNGATIRPDDVAKALKPILEVSQTLRDHLDGEKLKQKFWISHFTDLIIDRTWNQISL